MVGRLFLAPLLRLGVIFHIGIYLGDYSRIQNYKCSCSGVDCSRVSDYGHFRPYLVTKAQAPERCDFDLGFDYPDNTIFGCISDLDS